MNLEELWQKTLGEMEVQLSRANFVTWLKNSQLVDQSDGTFYVSLPNNFAKEWVENKYEKKILGILRDMDNSAKNLEFLVNSDKVKKKNYQKKITESELKKFENKIDLDFTVDPKTNLNSRYTMESFVVGSSNELAFNAAEAIIENVGKKYNPFFVYGGVGLGKTHLIQAIGNEIRKKYKGKIKSRYVPSEKFTNEVIAGIRGNRMEDIKKKYRGCDVFIIDDIQFIGGKEKTMEEFFHTFNALHQNDKQIIISSDRSPQSLSTLEDRLRSRFEGGLVTDISYPDYEMKFAITKAKLEEMDQDLDDSIIDLIAKKVKYNVRELEGVLNKLIFLKEMKKMEITEDQAKKVIKETLKHSSDQVSEDKIMECVAEFFNLQSSDLTKKTRKRKIVEPRQITMYLFREVLEMSYPSIGEKLGKDHTTAIHAVGKIEKEINKNSSLNEKINLIKDLMYRQ